MNSKPYAIGVLGGMGTYATIHLFRQYAEVFPAEKEWDRPRIIIDNRCTMPSRVRAALYGENREQLICEMSDSVRGLIRSGCSRILLACNTAHLFLEDIYRQVPEAGGRVLNIIETCADGLSEHGVREVLLLASDASDNARRRAENFAAGRSVIRVELPFSKEELASVTGVSGGSMAAVTDLGFANALAGRLRDLDPERYGSLAEETEKRLQRQTLRKSSKNKSIGKRRTNHEHGEI